MTHKRKLIQVDLVRGIHNLTFWVDMSLIRRAGMELKAGMEITDADHQRWRVHRVWTREEVTPQKGGVLINSDPSLFT